MNLNTIKRRATIARHSKMSCKVYQLKIDKSKLSVKSKGHLDKLFLEAKWFYNWCIAHTDYKTIDTKVKTIQVKVGDKFEDRKLEILSGQMKQAIRDRMLRSVKMLKTKKEKGIKVGKLKFKSNVCSIPLQQFGRSSRTGTYWLNKSSAAIQGMGIHTGKLGVDGRKWLKVNGLDQLPKDVEFCNANLIKRDNDYYLYVTTFRNKENINIPNKSIGIDFGIKTQLAFSNNIKIEYQVPVSKKLKRIDRKIQRKFRKPSKSRIKDEIKRRKVYQHLTNKKKDIRCKIVNAIKTNYKYVCVQDDCIKGWAKRYGKRINSVTIGGIMVDLKNKSHTPLVVDKWFASTQLCPKCNQKTKHKLNERTYTCFFCDYTEDRDLKSAQSIEIEGLKQVPTDHRELVEKSNLSTPEEIITTAFFNTLKNIHGIKVKQVKSLNQEALEIG